MTRGGESPAAPPAAPGRPVAVVVLAAGEGRRMNSDLPKVLHTLADRPMIRHVLDRAAALAPARVAAVVGAGAAAERVRAAIAPTPVAVQDPALGTAHAALAARPLMEGFDGSVLILFGDTPLLTDRTLRAVLAPLGEPGGPALVAAGFRPPDPEGYGRLVVGADGALEAIVEHREASPAQREIGLCNAGVMAVDARRLFALLDAVGDGNAGGEYYLTDVVAVARARGLFCAVREVADSGEAMGVNTRADLAAAERVVQDRLRARAMAGGATLRDPASVRFSHDTALGRDVTVGPHVVFGPGAHVGDRAEIRAFCHIEGARIAEDAVVGPFARLRPDARIGAGARVGNFVEIKAATLERGAKVNHLSYVGDAHVGAAANIGAGAITCNYDGVGKSRTEIGARAFIGSNSSLVAPVSIGAGAATGAGSAITRDVPAGALAVERGPQRVREGWTPGRRRKRGRDAPAAAPDGKE